MARRLVTILVLCIALSLSACAQKAVFTYQPEGPLSKPARSLPLTVGVMPFVDSRAQDNKSSLYLCALPLVPYCSLSYDRPEAAETFLFQPGFTFNPSEDFARAVAAEFAATGLFQNVIFPWQEGGPRVDLVVTGAIMETRYYGSNISYGFSVWSPLLWYIGLPAGVVHNTLSLSLRMKRSADQAVVWSQEVNGKESATLGFYYNWKADFAGYETILKSGLREGVGKLEYDLK